MLAIIDYGVGNLFSLQCSLKKIGVDAVVTNDAQVIRDADRIILPGVGAFGDAINKLRSTGLVDTIKAEAEKGKPFLGICLGMQLLFEKGYEYGVHDGLGFLKGNVVPLEGKIPAELNVPHMGWNSLKTVKDHPSRFLFTVLQRISEARLRQYIREFPCRQPAAYPRRKPSACLRKLFRSPHP